MFDLIYTKMRSYTCMYIWVTNKDFLHKNISHASLTAFQLEKLAFLFVCLFSEWRIDLSILLVLESQQFIFSPGIYWVASTGKAPEHTLWRSQRWLTHGPCTWWIYNLQGKVTQMTRNTRKNVGKSIKQGHWKDDQSWREWEDIPEERNDMNNSMEPCFFNSVHLESPGKLIKMQITGPYRQKYSSSKAEPQHLNFNKFPRVIW